jgi:hypothetical protein
MHCFAASIGARAQYQGHNERATTVPARRGAFCGKLLCTIYAPIARITPNNNNGSRLLLFCGSTGSSGGNCAHNCSY